MIALALAAVLACGNPVVIDGDTLACSGQRVRLYGIDTPERGRPGADRATRRLHRLTRGLVRCAPKDTDRYGRIVATCTVGGRDIGATLLSEGLACWWPRYDRQRIYAGLGRTCDRRRK